MAIERLSELRDRLRAFAQQRNWAQFHTPKNLACSVSIEAGELLELFQWSGTSLDELDADGLSRAGEEIADVMFYLVMLSDRLGIDLPAALEAKLAKNEAKYPVSEAYGRATKATERPA